MTASYDTIERLRNEIAGSTCPLLDRKLIDSTVIHDVAAVFRLASGSKTAFPNVPIHSIASLARKGDAWMEGDTWRDVAVRRLHGTDWPADVFEYFENEMGNARFPSPNSRGRLELTCYGGVTVCSNGNHRLAAGYCWLAATHGAEAQLKSVNTTLVPIARQKVQMVLAAATDELATLSVSINPTSCLTEELGFQIYVRIVSAAGAEYFGVGDGLELLWTKRRSLSQRLVHLVSTDLARTDNDLKSCLELQNWATTPRIVLDVWADCEWFDDIYTQA